MISFAYSVSAAVQNFGGHTATAAESDKTKVVKFDLDSKQPNCSSGNVCVEIEVWGH